MEFCDRRERSGPTPNAARETENLWVGQWMENREEEIPG